MKQKTKLVYILVCLVTIICLFYKWWFMSCAFYSKNVEYFKILFVLILLIGLLYISLQLIKFYITVTVIHCSWIGLTVYIDLAVEIVFFIRFEMFL